jgi:hypothetical protein
MPALVIAELSWQPGCQHYSRAGVARDHSGFSA